MPLLTNTQLRGLASPDLDAGTELDHDWTDPYPDAPCWAWALFGGDGGHADNTPPVIFQKALQLNSGGGIIGVQPGFQQWVQQTFQNPLATAEAAIIQNNFALGFVDGNAQLLCTRAFARLCIILAGLTVAPAPTDYSIVMASDNWWTWEHWALGLTNNLGAPANPPVQYTQRDAGVNPVNTRCHEVWGPHPILTSIHIAALQPGHIDYLKHAAGWPG